MAKLIEYLRDARMDFDQSFDWYAERSIGAAVGFACAVDDAMDRIWMFPGQIGRGEGVSNGEATP